jgi:hypothetical protein
MRDVWRQRGALSIPRARPVATLERDAEFAS